MALQAREHTQRRVRHASPTIRDSPLIPVLDFSLAASSDLTTRRSLARQLHHACTNVGFFYLRNHGIPQSQISQMFDAAKDFHSRPLDAKMKSYVGGKGIGYEPVYSSQYDADTRGDYHEGFQFAYEPRFEDGVVPDKSHDLFSNGDIWPDDHFKSRVLNYYRPVLDLSRKLMRVFALSLDLSEDYFDSMTTHPGGMMRLLHYPPQTLSTDVGIGAHTDFEIFTILATDATRNCLSVLSKDGWIYAQPIEGCLLVNVADFLQRLTNDLYLSTIHRVRNTEVSKDGKGVDRYSCAFFFSINYDLQIETLPSCITADRPKKYEPITAGEYLKARLENADNQ